MVSNKYRKYILCTLKIIRYSVPREIDNDNIINDWFVYIGRYSEKNKNTFLI